MRTQVGIIGAGPAGLTLGQLLHREGIDSVIVEKRSRAYVEARIRAGVLEQGVVDLLTGAGVGGRLAREGLVHEGLELQFAGERHRLDLRALTGQDHHRLRADRDRERPDRGAARHRTTAPVRGGRRRVQEIESERPRVLYTYEAERQELECDVVAGCDGFHGVCRPTIPTGVLRTFAREYPFGWLGILAAVAPSNDELVYANHERGFALLSMRSPELSRLYVQCSPDEDIAEWPDERIWEELQVRLGLPGWTLARGAGAGEGHHAACAASSPSRCDTADSSSPATPRTSSRRPARRASTSPSRDVRLLADALASWYRTGKEALLDSYSTDCLRRVWRAEHFSWWMTTMLHRPEGGDPFELKLQESQLRYVTGSRAGATMLAENYVGLDVV